MNDTKTPINKGVELMLRRDKREPDSFSWAVL